MGLESQPSPQLGDVSDQPVRSSHLFPYRTRKPEESYISFAVLKSFSLLSALS